MQLRSDDVSRYSPKQAVVNVHERVSPRATRLEQGSCHGLRHLGHFGMGGLPLTIQTLDESKR